MEEIEEPEKKNRQPTAMLNLDLWFDSKCLHEFLPTGFIAMIVLYVNGQKRLLSVNIQYICINFSNRKYLLCPLRFVP